MRTGFEDGARIRSQGRWRRTLHAEELRQADGRRVALVQNNTSSTAGSDQVSQGRQ